VVGRQADGKTDGQTVELTEQTEPGNPGRQTSGGTQVSPAALDRQVVISQTIERNQADLVAELEREP